MNVSACTPMNQAAVPSDDWSPEVRSFCRENGVSDDLRLAVGLARQTFLGGEVIAIQRKEDIETGAVCVQIKVSIGASVEEAVAAYDRYIAEWVTATSPEARRLVRLSFKII